MKQHIAIEQLNELSEKGKKKLRKWWVDKNYVRYGEYIQKEKTIPALGIYEGYIHPTDPLLSIGQMIEFLGNDYEFVLHRCSSGSILAEDVCDVLWEAIREILKR